jgi:hypothetical protein
MSDTILIIIGCGLIGLILIMTFLVMCIIFKSIVPKIKGKDENVRRINRNS